MYEPGTILTLKTPRDPDDETGEPFAYNRVKVIGESPVAHPRGEWEGADAAGVVIVPLTNFGANLDEPFGRLRSIYDVESIPVVEVPVQPTLTRVNATTAAAGPTPEEVFERDAPGTPPLEGEIRARTNPLGEDEGPASKRSPL